MYFNGNLSIDPAQLTKIQKIKPQKAFKRILYFLTFGSVTDQLEQETFTAVSILQQLYQVFTAVGINDLVRLSHDGIDFYLDQAGKNDDLKDMLDKYDLETNEAMSKVFEQLQMVLEHKEGSFHYLFDIHINRTHKVGEYPIEISVDALINDFKLTDDAKPEMAKEKMSSVFKDQSSYNGFILSKQAEFEQYLSKLKLQITKHIKVDDVKLDYKAKIIIPKTARKNPKELVSKNRREASPVYHGYYGIDDAFFYAWIWSELCFDNNMQINNTTLISEDSHDIMDIGDDGIDARADSFFDPNSDFDSALSDHNLSFDDSVGSFSEMGDVDDGWFGASFGGDVGDSSCSSCSSCGGCGGCGG